MARKRRRHNQPSAPRVIADPAEGARLSKGGKPSDWGVDTETLEDRALAASQAVEIKSDYRGVITGRWRYDCFELLYRRRSSESHFPDAWYFAIRRLQTDLAILHRTQGASDAIRVTGKGAVAALSVAQSNEDAELRRFVISGFGMPRVQAGERIYDVLTRIAKPGARLLLALCEPEIASGQSVNWHATVTKHRGEYDRHNRGKIVREACGELARAYAEIDNEPRRVSA